MGGLVSLLHNSASPSFEIEENETVHLELPITTSSSSRGSKRIGGRDFLEHTRTFSFFLGLSAAYLTLSEVVQLLSSLPKNTSYVPSSRAIIDEVVRYTLRKRFGHVKESSFPLESIRVTFGGQEKKVGLSVLKALNLLLAVIPETFGSAQKSVKNNLNSVTVSIRNTTRSDGLVTFSHGQCEVQCPAAYCASSIQKSGHRANSVTSLLCCEREGCNNLLRACHDCAPTCPNLTCQTLFICSECQIEDLSGNIIGCQDCCFVCSACKEALAPGLQAICSICSDEQVDAVVLCLDCHPRGHDDFYSCQQCNSVFCIECDGLVNCDFCQDGYCAHCPDIASCSTCGLTSCRDCEEMWSCEECGQNLCSECLVEH